MCTIAKKKRCAKKAKEEAEDCNCSFDEESKEEQEEQEDLIEDAQDVALLQAKAYGDILLMWSYIFEYFATIGEIQAIFTKQQDKAVKDAQKAERESDEDSSEDEEDESENDLGRDYFISLNSDATAVSAAAIGLYGQTILTNIAGIRYSRYLEHFGKKKLAVVKSANDEIYISALLEEAAFLLEFVGAQKIYNIKKTYPFIDTE